MYKTFSKSNPCTRDCPNRCLACHDTCEKYATFTAKRKKQKKWLERENGVGAMEVHSTMNMLGYNKSKHRNGGNAGAKFYGIGA